MDKRRYVQRARAESSVATRRRILDAARATLERGPVGALRVDEVARAAGGLALDRVRPVRLPGGYFRRAGSLPPRRGWVREAHRRLTATRRHGQPAHVAARRGRRSTPRCPISRAPCSRWVRSTPTRSPRSPPSRTASVRAWSGWPVRWSAQGYLRDDVSVEEATDILTVITSFQSFDELFTGSQLPASTIAERLIAMAVRSLCRPEASPGSATTASESSASGAPPTQHPQPAGRGQPGGHGGARRRRDRRRSDRVRARAGVTRRRAREAAPARR